MTFKPGDEVQHLSGGPKMVVTGDGNYGGIVCRWWDEKLKDFKSENFEEVEIRPYQAPSGGRPFVVNPR